MANKKLVDIENLAEYLDVSVATIYTWTSRRKVPYLKVGRLVKFDLQEIDEWLNQKKVREIKVVK